MRYNKAINKKNNQQKELDIALLELKEHIIYMNKHQKDFKVTSKDTFENLKKLLEDI